MANREFLMQAHKYDPKRRVIGWLMSEKLDGIRCLWLPATRNVNIENIPWANRERDKRRCIATGLWSRYGKVFHAPSFWLDKLPNVNLDGELWAGRGGFQKVSGVVKSLDAGNLWKEIEYKVFDSPPSTLVCQAGKINNQHWKVEFKGDEMKPTGQGPGHGMYTTTYNWLASNTDVSLIEHRMVSRVEDVETYMDEVLSLGGEGIVIRNGLVGWEPKRSWGMLKLKGYEDDECVIEDFEVSEKLQGLVAAYWVSWNGRRFKITNGRGHSERHIEDFKKGERVTFRYRELTDDGIPKEARFTRRWEGV